MSPQTTRYLELMQHRETAETVAILDGLDEMLDELWEEMTRDEQVECRAEWKAMREATTRG